MKLVKNATVDKWLTGWAKAHFRGHDLTAPVDAATRKQAQGEAVTYARIFLDLAGGHHGRYWERYITARNNRVKEIRDTYRAELETVAKHQRRQHRTTETP